MSDIFNNISDISKEKNIKIKALEVTQALCIIYNEGKKSQKSAERVIEQIYKCTHVALGTCPNPHKDWFEGLNDIYKQLRRTPFLDDK